MLFAVNCPMTTWNPQSYNKNARFVSELGSPVVGLLDPLAGESILDLGCGDGFLTRKLQGFGCKVLGVDASPEMASAARLGGLEVRVIDGHELPFDGEFDAVFSNAALHWMRQPAQVIAGVWRALRHPGRFVAEMGGIGNVRRLQQALSDAMTTRGIAAGAVEPWYFPSPDEYRGKLEAAGFEVDYIELIERPTPLPTGVAGWVESVAHPYLEALPAAERGGFLADIERRVAPFLRGEDGAWFADYVRLRFRALKR